MLLYVVLSCVIVACFLLEMKASKCVEKGCETNKLVRIDTDKFRESPDEELVRYIESVTYFNNIWRVAAIITCLVMILFLITKNYQGWPFVVILTLAIFTVCYQVINCKVHHSYDFVFKSLVDALSSKGDFKQIVHPS